MRAKIHKASIEYAGLVEDPMSDSALRLDFIVTGPDQFVEHVNIYFTDRFIESYFNIPWNKKLDVEENRLIHEKQDLFVKWALAKVESFLTGELKSAKITLDEENDLMWARQIEAGELSLISKPLEEGKFDFQT